MVQKPVISLLPHPLVGVPGERFCTVPKTKDLKITFRSAGEGPGHQILSWTMGAGETERVCSCSASSLNSFTPCLELNLAEQIHLHRKPWF